MLYEKLYPHMKRINEERDGIMRGTCKEPCCMCGRLTEYIEINYQDYFCSEECLAEFDNRLFSDRPHEEEESMWP